MLDVHPPHQAAHTWKDFFIHIATIVVGLLIAVGLEQSVEYVHHRHQVAETRYELQLEREKAARDLARWAFFIPREHAALMNNLLVLQYIQSHPGAPQTQLPGILTWHNSTDTISNSAWTTAMQSGVMLLFPGDEVHEYGNFYTHLDTINQAGGSHWTQINEARLYAFKDPDPTHMKPAELERATELTTQCLKTLYLLSVAVNNLNRDFPEIATTFSDVYVNSLAHATEVERNPSLTDPIAQTIERINAAGKYKDFLPQSVPAK